MADERMLNFVAFRRFARVHRAQRILRRRLVVNRIVEIHNVEVAVEVELVGACADRHQNESGEERAGEDDHHDEPPVDLSRLLGQTGHFRWQEVDVDRWDLRRRMGICRLLGSRSRCRRWRNARPQVAAQRQIVRTRADDSQIVCGSELQQKN